jgi:NADH dehydrogenase FAD-containing subunit/uncharacterized membrane protein YphA (DoxX/SURF4 family)
MTAPSLTATLRASSAINAFWIRAVQGLAWPKVDLAIRLWLAQIFVVSGVLKLTHWQTAIDLATNEYPVSWLAPVTAAWLGVATETIGGGLLALGFMTRYAAIPLLILSLVIQTNYLALDSQLFWVALFGWYAVHGAGSLSIDRLLRRGLADSALPLIPRIVRASQWTRCHVSPWYLTALRVWLAAALAGMSLPLWLPLQTVQLLPVIIAVPAAVLLATGLATRYTAAALMVALCIGSMGDPRLTDSIYLIMCLCLLVTFGAGAAAVDSRLADVVARCTRQTSATTGLPRVVIVGAGFGGISCAARLRRAPISVTLIDRANHHLFQPLLYQVATAALSPGDIAAPVRPLFRDAANVRVLLGTVTGVDRQAQTVLLGERSIPYDYLVLATGAAHSYFGKDQWAPYAPGLKRVEDATEMRRRILLAFERAEAAEDAAERAAQLTFLIVGGGPTGVELAGAIAELAHFGMDKEFRAFDPADARVILVQSAPRLLPAFDERLAAIAQRSLQQLGVDVRLGSRVEDIDADGVVVSGKRIAARTVLWAAGVAASPAARWLGVAADNAGRIEVGADLSVPGVPNVYAIGDTALSLAWQDRPVPGLAPAAKQAGDYVARQIRGRVDGTPNTAPFAYRHRGSLATIGRKAAVADFGPIRLWGAPAWWLWGLVHVGFLVGLRNRIATMLNWFWAYLTFGGGIRLITGADPVAPPVASVGRTSLTTQSAA